MTRWRLVLASLRFYWRTHLGVLLGAAIGTAVLVGALGVGDSVRHTLAELARLRLGRVQLTMHSGDRLVRAALGGELGSALDAPVAAALHLRGVASSADGSARANTVQVIGADQRFWRLAPDPAALNLPGAGEVVLNARLARQLRADAGQEIVLRIEKPAALPADAPLASDGDAALAVRLRVAGVAGDTAWSRFALRADQTPPYTAFLDRAWLSQRLGLPEQANLLLVGAALKREAATIPAERGNEELARHWQLEDAQLDLRAVPSGALELRSPRVFLDAATVRAATEAGAAASADSPPPQGVLTYFVNELRVGERAAPYSMVAAIGSLDPANPAGGPLPPDMRDDEIIINAWLAEDLAARAGDELTLTYFTIGSGGRLAEQSSRFRIRAIVPIDGWAADPTLMPDFPGLAGAENCRDWDPSLPVDLDRIRPKDEAYWDAHRGTPKAFVTLAAGRAMWANRFGDLTAVRYPAATDEARLGPAILARLDPADLGLSFTDVRSASGPGSGGAAASPALDFGQLFLGLSFFLIVAGALLTGLLFALGVDSRSAEAGALAAMGFAPRRIRRLLLAEAALLALAGAAAGAAAGLLYCRLTLLALGTLWRGAVSGAALWFHIEPASVAGGAAAGWAVAMLASCLAARRQALRHPVAQLTGGAAEMRPGSVRAWTSRPATWLGLAALSLAALGAAWAGRAAGQRQAAGALFGLGALVLLGATCLCYALLTAGGRSAFAPGLSRAALAARQAARRPSRSLATVALLACGSFLIVAIGAHRQPPIDPVNRASGTGGFALYAESTLPVRRDLNSPAGRAALGLGDDDLAGAAIVPLRVRDGDDASCLNLNRAVAPRILGVPVEALASREAFTFSRTLAPAAGSPWRLLEKTSLADEPDVIPAIADEASAVWAMGKSLGDDLEYTDERGRPIRLRLVGFLRDSIFQGGVLIAEPEFERSFPSIGGHRAFLIDAPPPRPGAHPGVHAGAALAATLTAALRDAGLEVVDTADRLRTFRAVQDTYLTIFQVLGGLGLILGSLGLGAVVLRNIQERRRELAMLRAVGFSRRNLARLLLWEHALLLLLGLACGGGAAAVAVWPASRASRHELPYASLALTLLAVLACGLAATWLATRAALRQPPAPALRDE